MPRSCGVSRELSGGDISGGAFLRGMTLCGEIAGWPRCFLPLFGMGLRRFSMTPGTVPRSRSWSGGPT